MSGRRARQIALAATSVGAALLAAEGAVRVLLPEPQTVRFLEWDEAASRRAFESEHPLESRQTDVHARPLYRDTPAGRRMRAGARVVIERHRLTGADVEIRTNSLGYRNPELGEKTAPRALFLGDSITLAGYLDEALTWVRLTEGLLRAEGVAVEAINAGIDTVGLEDELAILMETGLSTEPDLVVLGFYLNDMQDSRGIELLSPPPWLGWSRLCRHLCIALPALRARAQPWLDTDAMEQWRPEVLAAFPPGDGVLERDPPAFHREIQRMYYDWGCAWSESAWGRMIPLFEELKRQADAHGFRLLVLCFPVRAQVEAEYLYDHPQRRLAQVASRLDLPLLDLLPILRDAHRTPRSHGQALFHDQCHPTAFGNRVVAQHVAAFLRPHLR